MQLEISVEEGMIQKLSRRAVADASVGCKLLDATLTEYAAMGLLTLVNQTYALIAAQCIKCSAQAAVQTIRSNAQLNTRFHHRLLPSGVSATSPAEQALKSVFLSINHLLARINAQHT